MGAIINTRRYFALTALSIGISFTAQAANTSTDSEAVLEEVVVTGLRANLNQSIQVKQAEDHIVEVIAADNMGQLPNVTVAESLVRLPGVNGARDRGNESLATVRGLGPRMTMGTVNGREVASSEPTRAVRWEVFPTEVVSTVKVYKTQSADLVAGGIAATIDISTVNPLDHTGPSFVATAGPVYYDEGKDVPGYSPWGNRVGASWIGKFGDNFGVAFGATYQKQKNANALMGAWGYNGASNAKDVNGDGTIDQTLWGAADELKQIEQTRTGAMGVLQWRGDNLELKLDGLYSKVKIHEDQNQTWFGGWDYSSWSSYNPYTSATVIDGNVVAGTLVNNSFNSGLGITHAIGLYTEDKTLTATGLNGKWSGEKWTFVGDLSFSAAKREQNWRAVEFFSNAQTLSYDFRSSSTPSISITGESALTGFNDWNDGPGELNDQITALAASAKRQLDTSFFNAIDVGARIANREKKYHFSAWGQNGSCNPESVCTGSTYFFSMPDLNVPGLLGGDINAISAAALGGWDLSQAVDQPLQHWKVKEDVSESYVKGTYDSMLFGTHIAGNVGVRVVHVKTASTGYDSIGGAPPTPASQGKSYTDVLPSATLNFLLDDTHMLRFAAAKVVARPPLDELRTGRSLDTPLPGGGQLYGSGANPTLDPFRAKQLDISYEWYFHKEALLALSTYRKWVDSSIGYKSGHETINGYDYIISGPFNGGGGYINGAELTFQTPFYFIPHLENFGIYSNYSYVDSNLHEFSPDNNPLPLSGLAKHTAAVDLWYSNGKFETRVGYKYHSPYTIIYGWTESSLSRLTSESIFDFSSSWQMTDMFGLKLQIGNLTNEKLRAYANNNPNELANKDGTGGYQAFGRRYSLEGTVKF